VAKGLVVHRYRGERHYRVERITLQTIGPTRDPRRDTGHGAGATAGDD